MEQKTLDECLALMDAEVRDDIRKSLKLYNSIGVLIFENHDLSSRFVGCKFAIGYGPDNTIKQLPEANRCPVEPPSGGHAWQYFLVAWGLNITQTARILN